MAVKHRLPGDAEFGVAPMFVPRIRVAVSEWEVAAVDVQADAMFFSEHITGRQ